jgi:hypothetical protein
MRAKPLSVESGLRISDLRVNGTVDSFFARLPDGFAGTGGIA